MNPLPGIDVAVYQGQPNWSQVANTNHFAFAKATEGVGFTDPSWNYNAVGLALPGPLVPGAYHFARPDLGNTPEAEANWFWNQVTAHVPDPTGWLLALDLEVGSGDLGSWRDRWCSRLSVLAGGYTPGWYTYGVFAQTHGLNVSTPYWGWFAWPDVNGPFPATAFDFAFQQYGEGPVTGIAGNVDLDRFFGERTQLEALTVGGSMALDPNDPIVQELRNNLSYLRGMNDQNTQPRLDLLQNAVYDFTANQSKVDEVIAAVKALPAAQQQAVLDAIAAVKADTTELRARVDKDLA